jgi:hypothetical protein
VTLSYKVIGFGLGLSQCKMLFKKVLELKF